MTTAMVEKTVFASFTPTSAPPCTFPHYAAAAASGEFPHYLKGNKRVYIT
jgi:hypothetical protein